MKLLLFFIILNIVLWTLLLKSTADYVEKTVQIMPVPIEGTIDMTMSKKNNND